MATFGPIASAAPNVLFDAAKLDRDVQGFQRNQLLMQNAQQDQQQQGYARDTEARIGLARQLVGMPEDQAAAAWGTERQRLQAAGFGRDLPQQFPGLERLRSVAASDLTTFQRLQIEEKKRQTDAFQGLFSGGAPAGQAPATPASMPGSGGDYVSRMVGLESGGNPNARNPRSSATGAGQFIDSTWLSLAPRLFDTAGMSREQILARRSDPALSQRAVALYGDENRSILQNAGLPATDATTALSHRYGPLDAMRLLKADRTAPLDQILSPQVLAANPDLRGKTAGDAVGFYEQRMGGGQSTAPSSSSAATLQTGPDGLTAEQRKQAAFIGSSNPAQGVQMMAQFRAQNVAEQERIRDNARRDAQFTASQAQQAEANQRAREALDLQRQTVERQTAAAQTSAQTAQQGRLATATQQEAPQLERIGSAAGIIANGNRLLELVKKDGISFSPGAGAASAVRGFFNESTDYDRNREDLRRHVTESVNAILNQASGPQTDQDAARARDQILNNLNDKGQVTRGLQALNGAMQRAQQIATARVQSRRRELGLPEADLSPYMNLPANVTDSADGNSGNAGGSPRGPAPGTVEGNYRFKGGNPADQANWEPI